MFNDTIFVLVKMKSIHTACEEGKLALVKRLIEKDKTLINLKDRRRWTPLFYACAAGNEELLEFLLENGASVNVRDSRKRTVLLVAVLKKCCGFRKGRISYRIVQMLLRAGVAVNAKDCRGQMALTEVWCWWDSDKDMDWMWKVFQLLLQNGAKVEEEVSVAAFFADSFKNCSCRNFEEKSSYFKIETTIFKLFCSIFSQLNI